MSSKRVTIMQNTLTKLVAVAATCLFGTSATAAFIELETRATTNGVDQSNFVASWFAQTSAIHTTTVDTFDNLRSNGSNRHSHLRVEFDYAGLGDWMFQFAPDAGFGGALYVNNLLYQQEATDLWWGYNWNATNELFDSTGAELMLGTNIFDVFWAEGCCNGGQSGRFSTNGGQDWMTLSVANLESMAVPEPGMLLLLCGGLPGLAFARRRRQA